MVCVVINPLLISNFARLSLRKTITDKKDVLTIAQFLLAHRSELSTTYDHLGILFFFQYSNIRLSITVSFSIISSICRILF
jgi:uncharacterized membrane protein